MSGTRQGRGRHEPAGPRRVLVTGGAGFIGSNLVRLLLLEEGREVWNLDLLTYAGCRCSVAELEGRERYHFVQGDIGDRELVARLFAEARPEAVLHLAAESHVDRSIADAGRFVQTNVVGTCVLLDEARRYWAELPEAARTAFRFVSVSTDEVYGSLGPEGRFTEETPYDPSSPYSATKAAADHLVRAYHRTHGLPTIVTSCSNNYGPYQFPEKLIPLTITRALAGETLPVYGRGENVRDWLYVRDHCRALWTVVRAGKPGRSYNIGGGEERRNLDLVNALCDILDRLAPAPSRGLSLRSYRERITFVEDRPGHDFRYAIDATRIRSELGWRPEEDFASGLEKTVRWYLDNQDWVRAVTDASYRRWIDQNYGERLAGGAPSPKL